MVKVHMSAKKYDLLCRYDNFLNVRKDKTNRYYVLFLFFYKDYFVHKIVTKLMHAGHKNTAFLLFRSALYKVKKTLGFQPFFFFKHIAFSMRQIYKVNTVFAREQMTYFPAMLSVHNQVTYGIGHLIASAKLLSAEERISVADGLCLVLVNCFLSKSKND